MKKKGANKVSSKEAAKSAFYGASSGAVSGGVSMGSTAAKSATEILVHKGIQAGANMTISTSAYIMQTSISGNEMSLYGTSVSVLGGFVSGVTFNAPMGQALGISLGLELAGNGEELIFTMTDPRWPASEGWVKMQQIVSTSKGDINIHYLYNQTLNLFDDFKLK